MYKSVPREIKDEIIEKIKQGQKAPSLASQYGISAKTIYTWLSKSVTSEVNLLEHNRLKRENEELKRIIGMMAFDLEQEKKRKIYQGFNQQKVTS
jgi:transposase